MEFVKYLEILKRWWFIVAALIIGAVASNLAANMLTVPLYQAYAKIEIITDWRSSTYGLRNLTNMVSAFQDPQNIGAVAQRARLSNFEGKVELKIEAQQNNTSLINIVVTSHYPEETSILANALASNAKIFFSIENDPTYVRFVKETMEALPQKMANLKLAAEKAEKAFGKAERIIIPGDSLIISSQDGWQEFLDLKNAQEEYFWLGKRQAELKDMKHEVKIIQLATVPSAPVSPKIFQNALIAAALALLAGVGIIFVIEYWKRTHVGIKV